MLLLHLFSSLTLTPQDACPTSYPSSLLADDLASHTAGKIEEKNSNQRKNPMSSHLYNKQPSCVWTHTSCLPSCDKESTQGCFLRISPSPVHWLSSQELLKDSATASLSSVPYIIFFFVEVVSINMFQYFPLLISKQINNKSPCSYFSAPFQEKKFHQRVCTEFPLRLLTFSFESTIITILSHLRLNCSHQGYLLITPKLLYWRVATQSSLDSTSQQYVNGVYCFSNCPSLVCVISFEAFLK